MRFVRKAASGAVLILGLALAACASSPPVQAPPSNEVRSSGTWTFAFDAGPGLASATLSGPDGLPTVRVTCRAPSGNLEIQDWTFSRSHQGAANAHFSIGAKNGDYPALVGGDGAGRQALSFAVPARDRILFALPLEAEVSTRSGAFTHYWGAGAASRLNDVLNACHPPGS